MFHLLEGCLFWNRYANLRRPLMLNTEELQVKCKTRVWRLCWLYTVILQVTEGGLDIVNYTPAHKHTAWKVTPYRELAEEVLKSRKIMTDGRNMKWSKYQKNHYVEKFTHYLHTSNFPKKKLVTGFLRRIKGNWGILVTEFRRHPPLPTVNYMHKKCPLPSQNPSYYFLQNWKTAAHSLKLFHLISSVLKEYCKEIQFWFIYSNFYTVVNVIKIS